MRRAFPQILVLATLATLAGFSWHLGLRWFIAAAVLFLVALVVYLVMRPRYRPRGPSRSSASDGRPTLGGKAARHQRPVIDEVVCTAFSPSACAPGDTVLVQVFAHTLAHTDMTRLMAVEFDPAASARGTTQLDRPVERGSELTLVLAMKHAEVEPPIQRLVWRGEPTAVQFSITVPSTAAARNLIGTIYVAQEGAPLGHLKFVIRVSITVDLARAPAAQTPVNFTPYRSAFVSYASPDRTEVLKRVQMLARLSVPFFQDVLSLEPGERWARALYKSIGDSDVFFLFWSTNAKNSQWVMKEVQYAIQCKAGDEFARPEIVPVIIEGPPPVPPPPELAHLHFNDRLIYFMSQDHQPLAQPRGDSRAC